MSAPPPERVPHALKKSIPESDADKCPDVSAPSSFFFDALPKEVLDNILKYLSRLPEANDWVPLIPLGDIVGLYGVRGELGRFMINRFNTLCVTKSYKRAHGRSGPMLWAKDIDTARRFVLAGGGQHLHTIIIGAGIYPRKEAGHEQREREIADDFFSNCPNVVSLCCNDKDGVWVSAFAGQLEKLEMLTHTSALVSSACDNLRELHLTVKMGYAEGTHLWEKLGSGLESLALNFIDTVTKERELQVAVAVEEIKTHCCNLRRISIYRMKYLNEVISSLLASYGEQLEYCHVEDMDEIQLTTITSACTNVRFSATVSEHAEVLTALKVLRHQLEKIRVVYYDGFYELSELTSAWNECVNIRDIDFQYCGIELAKAMMAAPKENAKSLRVRPLYDMEADEVRKMIDIFSEGTVSVENFVYSGLRLSADAFDTLIESNKASLCALSFLFDGGIKKMDTFLPRFHKCPALEDVYGKRCIWNKETLKALERRGITVHDSNGYPFCLRSPTEDMWLL